MSFLQPAMLLALPVIALPVIIHLINRRRYQTVHWPAMAFLLAAKGMSRGKTRLRRWLILAARTLALAALVLFAARPLMSGWLGAVAGSRAETTIVVLDLSPSMEQSGRGGASKLETAKKRLIETLEVLPTGRLVLITPETDEPIELSSPQALRELAETQPTSATSDIPGLLLQVGDYLRANRPTRCDVWIASDLRRSDWDDASGRWRAARATLAELPSVLRFHLLTYPDPPDSNRALRVAGVRRTEDEVGGPRLVLSLEIDRRADDAGEQIPIALELDGARSQFRVTLEGSGPTTVDQVIPLDDSQLRGWGRVSLPPDSNRADNDAYFVYDRPPEQKALIVASDRFAAQPLQWAASSAPHPEIRCEVQWASPDRLAGTDWDAFGLVLWQAPLPNGEVAEELRRLVARGGQLIFFPPQVGLPAAGAIDNDPTGNEFAGLRWGEWVSPTSPTRVSSWIRDHGLLADASGGEALPVETLTVSRYRRIEGPRIAVATLGGEVPLVARATEGDGRVHFCATTVEPDDSSLAENGVVLYALVQRTLAAGSRSLGTAREVVAGEVDPATRLDVASGGWRRVAGPPSVPSTRFHRHAGVYRSGERWYAVGRSASEDESAVVDEARLETLFEGLDVRRIDDRVEAEASLVGEVWRWFLVLMIAALVVEAALSLPANSAPAPGGTA